MIAWFIIALATLAVFGFIAVNAVQTVSMTADAAGRVETVRRLDAAVSALLARAASPDGNGIVYLPVGKANPAGEGYGLPDDMSGMATTPFGKRLVYCPFGDSGYAGSALVISSANGTSYSVATKEFQGKSFVVGGRPAYPQLAEQPNLVGLVMAPRSKLSVTPSCNQVIYNPNTGKFEAPDAVVRSVTREGGVDEARTVDARKLTFYVSPTGTGKGATSADPASLAMALNYYKSRLPAFMTINMATGNYVMGPIDLDIGFETNNFGSNLTINGVPGGTMIDMTSQGDLKIPGQLVISGVTFDQDANVIVDSGAKFGMYNSSVGSVKSKGTVSFAGSNALTQSKNDFALHVIDNAKVHILGTVNFYNLYGNGIYVAGNGALTAASAQLNFNSANSGTYKNGIFVSAGSSVAFNNSVLNFPVGTEYGIRSNGDVTLQSTNMQFGGSPSMVAINTMLGSRLGILNSYIGLGVRPNIAVNENGASQVYGNFVTIYSISRCWTGPLFSDSLHESGAKSSVIADVNPGTLPAAPTSAQIANYTNIQANNARKGAKRQNNASDWTCTI